MDLFGAGCGWVFRRDVQFEIVLMQHTWPRLRRKEDIVEVSDRKHKMHDPNAPARKTAQFTERTHLSALANMKSGNIGLEKALRRYEPSKSYKFSTYAAVTNRPKQKIQIQFLTSHTLIL